MNLWLGRIGIGVGLAIIAFAVIDWRINSGPSPDPVVVDLADVEAGNIPTNTYWKIGPHHAMRDLGVFSYSRLTQPLGSEVGPMTEINRFWYPIISDKAFFAMHSGLEKFSVLVETKEFEHVGDVKRGQVEVPSLEGLIIGGPESLPNGEVELIKNKYHFMDVSKLLVLVKDQHPFPAARAIVVAVVGAGAIVGGLLARERAQSEAAAARKLG